MKKFGIRTQGTEVEIESVISKHAEGKDNFIYLEIGVASCVTLKAVNDILKDSCASSNNWITIGLDIIGSGNVNFQEIYQNFSYGELPISSEEGELLSKNELNIGKYNSLLVLRKNPRLWVNNIKDFGFDLVLIDACHGKPCVMADFLTIENKIKPGGLCMFHDCGTEETGTDWQGHCNENINVRNALVELGLLDNSRVGWSLIKEIHGTRKTNKDSSGGNSMAIFRKD